MKPTKDSNNFCLKHFSLSYYSFIIPEFKPQLHFKTISVQVIQNFDGWNFNF